MTLKEEYVKLLETNQKLSTFNFTLFNVTKNLSGINYLLFEDFGGQTQDQWCLENFGGDACLR